MASATDQPDTPVSTPARPARGLRRLRRGEGRDWALMVLGALALAAVSLLVLPGTTAYDPQSWLIWGREIDHLALHTAGAATAVKPFPIFVDVLLAPAGAAAPTLWLLVARAGTLLALALAFRLGHRLSGVLAGLVAAVALAMSTQFLGYLFRGGMSEPMATAAVLAAADSHLRSRRGAALGFLVVAGLLRPEAWPAVMAYSVWVTYRGGAWRRLGGLVLAVAVPAVWFVIDWFGSGQLSRSAHAATHQSQGGPLLSREPGLATVTETWNLMSGPVLVLFLLGFGTALVAWRRSGRPGPLVLLGLGAFAWLAVDAVLAQGRFATGAPRYLLPGVGLACVVAGCFVADLARALRRRLAGTPRLRWVAVAVVVVALLAVCAPGLTWHPSGVEASLRLSARQHAQEARLPAAVATAGGRAAILRCGEVSTGPFQVPLLAWQLHLPLDAVHVARPGVTGTVIEMAPASFGPGDLSNYRVLAGRHAGPDSGRWVVLTTCQAPARP